MRGPGTLVDLWNGGTPVESFTAEERAKLREMIRTGEGYTNPKHPEHANFAADLRQLYAADFPDQPEPSTVLVNGQHVDLNAPRGGQ